MKKQTQTSRNGFSMVIVLLVVAAAVAAGVGYVALELRDTDNGIMEKTAMMDDSKSLDESGHDNDDKMDGEKMDKMEKTEAMKKMSYYFLGQLEDVTNNKNVLGINTGGKAIGTAKSGFYDGKYMMYASFKNLPTPTGTDFYEGWIVRKGDDFDVISTGRVKKTSSGNYYQYDNTYTSAKDLTDHTFYVLTIEPDDGDPAPAGHILEGTMTKI
jgi:hypothetical protein